jgi:hypothetical protein
MVNPHRDEIEQMLRAHQRSHFAQTFFMVEAGLSDEQIAVERNVSTARSVRVRKAVEMVLDDQLVASKSWASIVAAIYRELLNYSTSEELRQHARTRIAQLQQIDPTIPSGTLGNLTLGANTRPKPEKPQEACPQCRLVHPGECW